MDPEMPWLERSPNLFGSGAIILPFSAFAFISGNLKKGVGLLVLWGISSLIRQLLEPKIMGKNLGVHPLLNLAAVYIGYSFFGVTGVVFLPISVVIIKNLLLPEERWLFYEKNFFSHRAFCAGGAFPSNSVCISHFFVPLQQFWLILAYVCVCLFK